MELSQRERLSELVEELTTSGQPQLSQDKMNELKKICKVSNDCIDHLYHSVMAQLNQEHCEVRLSAFQIASELFTRSHHFRTLLVDNFQEFLELTVETDSDQPLPPPKEVARKLRSLALQTVQSWQALYGTAYKKLALGYHFLKQVKKVDFQDAEARSIAERRREEERRRRMERIYKEKVEAASKDMEDSYQEIEATLTEIEACMGLLFPEFGLTDIQTVIRNPSNSQQALKCPLDDEQPCCSKNMRDNRTRGMDEEVEGSREERKGNGKEDKMSKYEVRRSGNEQEEEKIIGGKVGDREENREIQKRHGEGEEEEENEEKEDGRSEEEEELYDEDVFIRNSGLISHSYSLDLNLSPGLHVQETEDNEAVVSTLIDLHRLITTKHLPAVKGWVQVFTKAGAEQQLLRRALDLRKSLEAALQKHTELHIDYRTRVRKVMNAFSDKEEDDDDDDDDFDEVPEKEGYEPHIPEHLRGEYGLDPTPSTSAAPVTGKPPAKRPAAPPPHSSSHSPSSRRMKHLTEEEQDPTCAAATLRLLRQNLPLSVESSGSSVLGSSQSSSDQKPVDAPVVPFGLDLYYWGQEQPNAGKIIKAASQHQFWVPVEVEEEVENEQLLAESRSRYISFPGSFTPVSHYCRAPLGNGKLCQRQDRLKCPFHGQIVPRDQEGRPCSQEDRLREERRKREEQPDWRDAELMRDIEAVTGENLGSDRVGKKGKGKKKKFPNLSDLKQSANTSRSRLEKKVFNKSSMRRVAQVMSKADGRKHDKFSNQFNYALN
ncbi:UV-stimulated scaffold protein A isoform X2 [Scophthalmus maximus]|uniref:UV-stimulated scaffold protein A isoform X2 n=1 Tax=Scophthalmus maximus TaxID=52904 RepID=UPI001FA86D66|nr:UV-stimulated scaffold protein A isoform X2 [Scophthalmus maximus]